MKSLYKMTDEEVIGIALGSSVISSAINNKSGSFNLQGCVQLAKEEIAKYFSDRCTLDQAVSAIQSRVSVYVAEQR